MDKPSKPNRRKLTLSDFSIIISNELFSSRDEIKPAPDITQEETS
ncbi:MAG: hypothetical protein ACTSR2_11735 [Candidatus Hodarchaeales archaeon]